MLAERRVLLDSAETVAACAEEMSEFLAPSESTETRAFVCSFVKAIPVRPGRATIHYTIPPPDSLIGGADASQLASTAARLWLKTATSEGNGPRRRKRPPRILGDGGRVRRQPRCSGAT